MFYVHLFSSFLFLLLNGHIHSVMRLKINSVLVLSVHINPFVRGCWGDLNEYAKAIPCGKSGGFVYMELFAE